MWVIFQLTPFKIALSHLFSISVCFGFSLLPWDAATLSRPVSISPMHVFPSSAPSANILPLLPYASRIPSPFPHFLSHSQPFPDIPSLPYTPPSPLPTAFLHAHSNIYTTPLCSSVASPNMPTIIFVSWKIPPPSSLPLSIALPPPPLPPSPHT